MILLQSRWHQCFTVRGRPVVALRREGLGWGMSGGAAVVSRHGAYVRAQLKRCCHCACRTMTAAAVTVSDMIFNLCGSLYMHVRAFCLYAITPHAVGTLLNIDRVT